MDEMKQLEDVVKRELRKNSKYLALEKKYVACVAGRNYVMAMQLRDAMTKIENIVRAEILGRYHKEAEQMRVLVRSMKEDDQMLMNVYGNLLCMLVDILDITIIDTNTLLRKYHPSFHIDMFDKIKQLGKECTMHVKMYDMAVKDEWHQNLYGDTADKMYKMCFNKSKSFINKLAKRAENEKDRTI